VSWRWLFQVRPTYQQTAPCFWPQKCNTLSLHWVLIWRDMLHRSSACIASFRTAKGMIYFIWVWDLVRHNRARTQAEGVWE
jgi:hypothetical protein